LDWCQTRFALRIATHVPAQDKNWEAMKSEATTMVATETGELQERRLEHREEAEKFYRDLAAQGMMVRLGMEASGHARW
jgi:hypothetical protein